MTCDECQLWLPEYLEQAVEEANRPAISQHLGGCGTCRASLTELQTMLQASKSLPRYAPCAEVLLRISRAIHTGTAMARRTEFGPVLDASELAEYLRVDMETLCPYLEEIPSFELGGQRRYRRKSVEEWIARREKDCGLEFALSDLKRLDLQLQATTGGVSWTN